METLDKLINELEDQAFKHQKGIIKRRDGQKKS